MRLLLVAVAALGCLLMSGCANQDRLVVYADPWLEDYAVALCAAYEKEHPEIEISLKVISTEVIAQHIHFGQPIDVALCYGTEWIQDPNFWNAVAEEEILAPSHVVEAKVVDPRFKSKTRSMGTENSIMMEASDRPSRRFLDAQASWLEVHQRQVVIANFQRQAEDYLLRGWVTSGFVPIHFLRQHPDALAEMVRGELDINAFSAIEFKQAPHPAQAASFFAYTNSEKSRQILGELKILP